MAGADGDRQASSWVALTNTAASSGSVSIWLWSTSRRRRSVFLAGFTGFEVAEAAQLAFPVTPDLVASRRPCASPRGCIRNDAASCRLPWRSVHHYRAEPRSMRPRRSWAMCLILVHHQECGEGSTGRNQCLMNGSPAYVRAPALACRMTGAPTSSAASHHGLTLFQVFDVEGRDAVAVGGGMVEHFAHRNEGHGRGSVEVGRRRVSLTGGGNRLVLVILTGGCDGARRQIQTGAGGPSAGRRRAELAAVDIGDPRRISWPRCSPSCATPFLPAPLPPASRAPSSQTCSQAPDAFRAPQLHRNGCASACA